ncbi:MAG: ribonuclease H-like domain-containing protein [archaeon GBS-70-058]|nr:ribonuclease H-like domain-containing protein [Candidatus Culexarchaeum nevadense]
MNEKGRIAFLDIESTSLTADSGFIVGVGIMWDDGKWSHEFLKGSVIEGEAELIRKSIDELSNATIIVTWNGIAFDIPMLIARAIIHDIDPTPIILKEHIDLYRYAKKLLKLSEYSLDAVAKYMGIPKKVELKGRDMPPYYMKAIAGDQEAMKLIIEHCYDDLQALKKIYDKMRKIVDVVKSIELRNVMEECT